jgi:hypothetical protein
MSISLRTAFASSLLLAAGAAAFGVQGCSSTSDNGAPDPAHFASAMAGGFCGALHSCCDAAHYQYDDGSCMVQMQDGFQSVIDTYKHGKIVYDANSVQACEDAYKAYEAQCSADASLPASADAGYVNPITRACWPVFKGTVDPGGDCDYGLQCKSPGPEVATDCTVPPSQGIPNPNPNAQKVCYQITMHAAPGSPCQTNLPPDVFTAARCEPTLGYCDTSGAAQDGGAGGQGSGTCKAFAKVGDSCIGQGFASCDPSTAYCDFQSGKCAAFKNVGESCQPPANCLKGLYCDPQAKTCAQKKADGSTCQNSVECLSSFCSAVPGIDAGNQGTCVSGGQGGDSTTDISPRSCGFGPRGTGPEDAGIVAPPKAQAFDIGASTRPWFELTR